MSGHKPTVTPLVSTTDDRIGLSFYSLWIYTACRRMREYMLPTLKPFNACTCDIDIGTLAEHLL